MRRFQSAQPHLTTANRSGPRTGSSTTRSLILLTVCLLLGHLSYARDPISPKLMVHRGASARAPENTLPALQLLVEDGFQWAEVDVRRTRDGHHVIFHDKRVDAKTDGTGLVRELTLAQLKQLDAGSWFNPRFSGEKILTLQECLQFSKGKLNLYLDCKDTDLDQLVREIAAAGMGHQVLVYVDTGAAKYLRKKYGKRVPVMVKWRPPYGKDDWLGQVQPNAVEIDAPDVTPEICRWFHSRGVRVEAKVLGRWDRPEWWDRVLAAGVDWLQTDRPEEIVAHRLWVRRASRPVQISFHRGARRYAPENTLPAIEKAIRMGADYVEIDVRTTRDGHHVLMHDDIVDRTTDGTGRVRDLRLDQIRGLDAGSWFGADFRATRVPTLAEALRVLKGKCGIYLDAKDIAAEELLAELRDAGVLDQTVVYQSPDYLLKLKELEPTIRTLCPLRDAQSLDSLYTAVHPYAYDVDWDLLSPELVAKCHRLGVRVFSDAFRYEHPDAYQEAVHCGIDVIQTDDPLRVIRALSTEAEQR